MAVASRSSAAGHKSACFKMTACNFCVPFHFPVSFLTNVVNFFPRDSSPQLRQFNKRGSLTEDPLGGLAIQNIIRNNVMAGMANAGASDGTDSRPITGRSARRIAPAALPALKSAPRTSFAVRY